MLGNRVDIVFDKIKSNSSMKPSQSTSTASTKDGMLVSRWGSLMSLYTSQWQEKFAYASTPDDGII